MSKDSHFTGQPVYSQVLKLLDKEKILQISRETKGSEAGKTKCARFEKRNVQKSGKTKRAKKFAHTTL